MAVRIPNYALRLWRVAAKQTTVLAGRRLPRTPLARFHGLSAVRASAAVQPTIELSDLQPEHQQGQLTTSKPARESEVITPKLVIFDKNGTLINFHKIWTPWVTNLTNRIEQMTGLNLERKIYKTLNFCAFTKKARPGVLAEGTTSQIKRHLEELLRDTGFSHRRAQLIVERCWKDCDTSDPATLEQMADLQEMFSGIREKGIKIAVLTTDNRKSTERTLQKLQLDKFIDLVLCGDDVLSHGHQPGARIQDICTRLGVDPREAVMVGDTEGDLEMGRDAQVGRTVGVLSGIGTRLDLSPHADAVVEDIQEALPFITSLDRPQVEAGQSISASSKSKVSLVIFDKDGTLICFNSIWTPWAMALVQRLENVSGLKVAEKTLKELGYCHSTEKWKPGIFAEGTTDQAKAIIQEVLQREGLTAQEAQDVVKVAWQHGDHSSSNKGLKPLGDLAQMFQVLKNQGIKVAVCTADSREATEQFLQTQGVEQYVDMLVCGDDPDAIPKPSGHNALKICEALGVPTSGAVVVGDTVADLGMGRRAKLGATVGVLSGVGQVDDLDEQADVMLPSIQHLLPLVLPPGVNV